ncbi:MAG: PaaX family transcriptional regulator [Nocardioidaceae bacterium]
MTPADSAAASDPPAPADIPPRQLIVSLYGLYARDEHNWLSVAALVRLMADLGVDAAAVRSSVSRLKRRDVLRAHKVDGAAGYALSPASVEILREGDARIFDRPRAVLTDGWLLLLFSIPESERDKRHTLRTQLTRLGYGTVSSGVWIAPGNLHAETITALERLTLTPYVEIFRADHVAFGDLRTKLAGWWDLDEIEVGYARFARAYAPVQARWAKRAGSPRNAFADYLPMLTAWRRLPYLDPGLPLELLRPGWTGIRTARLFHDLDAQLRSASREHALALIRG